MAKLVGVVVYAVLLSVFFGFFISGGSGSAQRTSSEVPKGSSDHPLFASRQEDENLITITSDELHEASSSSESAMEIGAEKVDQLKFDGTVNHISITE